jgi:uncharacterized membrane protein YphA (DoxX/SURF4 family)
MVSSGIYVELPIQASLDALWEYTQNPSYHEEWDLRFTSIKYLPKQSPNEPQQFLYTTQIGFGFKVTGKGESIGTRHASNGESTSALKFWSDQPISLIQAGSGYWKYIPQGSTIQFLTWYDYQVRFGLLGRLVDHFFFRPLLGWATAWSFDALRLWLEQGIHPAQSKRRLFSHVILQVVLAWIWIYQGLVPKLLFPDSGELAILQAAGLVADQASIVLTAVGWCEMLFGVLFLLPYFGKYLHYLNIAALLVLLAGAWFSQQELLFAPFNPISLTLAMMALSWVSLLNLQDLPAARHCLRRTTVR